MGIGLRYKGYIGNAIFNEESGRFFGILMGIEDYVSFDGADLDELTRAFKQAVDDYLRLCADCGKTPSRPRPDPAAATRQRLREQERLETAQRRREMWKTRKK